MKPKRLHRIVKPLWWLSFANEHEEGSPVGSGFLGVVILRARDMIEAVRIAHILQINPGGQAMGIAMPPDFNPPDKFRNRLLTRAEVEELQGTAKTMGEWEQEGSVTQ